MIRLHQITKRYGPLTAVDSVSFEIPPASSLVIQGPSGSGKTTLLRLIAGLEVPDGGEIHIDGQPASNRQILLPPHRRGIGFVFQSPALWPHMTVAQNILFGLHNLPKSEAKVRLQRLLEETALAELAGRYPHQLSGGEARRVSLARSLAPNPRCLLMDEPLTNLDDELKGKMIALIKEMTHQHQTAMVYVTHNIEEAKIISPDILVMNRGKLYHPSENLKGDTNL